MSACLVHCVTTSKFALEPTPVLSLMGTWAPALSGCGRPRASGKAPMLLAPRAPTSERLLHSAVSEVSCGGFK